MEPGALPLHYMMGMQRYAAGESLIEWMVWDVMRGVDLLLARKDIDPDRIVMLGSVAAGGEPEAVTALDRRIAAVAPFNFGEAELASLGVRRPRPTPFWPRVRPFAFRTCAARVKPRPTAAQTGRAPVLRTQPPSSCSATHGRRAPERLAHGAGLAGSQGGYRRRACCVVGRLRRTAEPAPPAARRSGRLAAQPAKSSGRQSRSAACWHYWGALYGDRVAAVAVRRGLAGYLSMLDDAFVYVPSDAVVPDSAAAGDFADRAERRGWIEPAIAAYKGAPQALELGAAAGPGAWIAARLVR